MNLYLPFTVITCCLMIQAVRTVCLSPTNSTRKLCYRKDDRAKGKASSLHGKGKFRSTARKACCCFRSVRSSGHTACDGKGKLLRARARETSPVVGKGKVSSTARKVVRRQRELWANGKGKGKFRQSSGKFFRSRQGKLAAVSDPSGPAVTRHVTARPAVAVFLYPLVARGRLLPANHGTS